MPGRVLRRAKFNKKLDRLLLLSKRSARFIQRVEKLLMKILYNLLDLKNNICTSRLDQETREARFDCSQRRTFD